MVPDGRVLPRRIDRTSEFRGTFWAPGSADERIGGTLRFVKGESRLTLRAPLEGAQVSALLRSETVLGQLDNGTLVTLWCRKGWPAKLGRDSSKWQRYHRTFDWALIGVHEDDYDDAQFSSWGVAFQSLAGWSQITTPLPPETDESARPQHAPARVSVESHQLEFHLRHPQRVHAAGEDLFEWDGHGVHFLVGVHPAAKLKFLDLISFDLQALMTFAYQRAAYVTAEFCWRDGEQKAIEVIRRLRVGEGERVTSRDDMILTADDLPFKQIIEAWWPAVDEIYPVTQVLSKEFYGNRGFVESSASSAIAATERMHEKVGKTKKQFTRGYLSRKRKQLRELFTEAEDAQYLQLLKGSVTVRPALATRLAELAESLGPAIFGDLGYTAETWQAKVREARNKLAHTGSHVDMRSEDAVADLYRVDAYTRAVLTLIVLQYFGVREAGLRRAAGVLQAAGALRLQRHGVSWS